MKDENFMLAMTEVEKDAWISLKNVIKNFLGNNKDPDFVNIIESMLQKFNENQNSLFTCSLRLFSENLGAVSKEHDECFHQDIKEMGGSYQGQWKINMMGDYCWMLHLSLIHI